MLAGWKLCLCGCVLVSASRGALAAPVLHTCIFPAVGLLWRWVVLQKSVDSKAWTCLHCSQRGMLTQISWTKKGKCPLHVSDTRWTVVLWFPSPMRASGITLKEWHHSAELLFVWVGGAPPGWTFMYVCVGSATPACVCSVTPVCIRDRIRSSCRMWLEPHFLNQNKLYCSGLYQQPKSLIALWSLFFL